MRNIPPAGRPGLRLLLLAAAAFVLASPAAEAHSYKLGDVSIGHVWAPPSDGTKSVPVYGPVLNMGDEPVTLRGVSSPLAERARLRAEDEGRVSWPETVEFPSGKPLALAPWRQHVWLTGLDHPLKAGDAFPLDLDFGAAGEVTVEVEVETKAGH